MIEKVIKNEEDCRDFGLALAERLKPGDVVALIGDLGVGGKDHSDKIYSSGAWHQ